MVRLKVLQGVTVIEKKAYFNSKDGAIKSWRFLNQLVAKKNFNSKDGAIKRISFWRSCHFRINFNSKDGAIKSSQN